MNLHYLFTDLCFEIHQHGAHQHGHGLGDREQLAEVGRRHALGDDGGARHRVEPTTIILTLFQALTSSIQPT